MTAVASTAAAAAAAVAGRTLYIMFHYHLMTGYAGHVGRNECDEIIPVTYFSNRVAGSG